MYEEQFGTDWQSIEDREEVIDRAYALGVAERLGWEFPDELDRLLDTADSNYDRSFVELAYKEGRHEASELDDEDDEEVWTDLVGTGEFDAEHDSDQFEAQTELPEALTRFDVESSPPDTTEMLARPGFLDREGAEEPDRRRQRKRPNEDEEPPSLELPEALREDAEERVDELEDDRET